MNSTGKLLVTLFGFVATYSVWLTPATAQQDPTPSPPKEEQPKPAATSVPWVPNGDSTNEPEVGPAQEGPPNPYAGVIKDVGTGLPLFGTSSSPLRWGSFSIYTFEYIGIHDDLGAYGTLNAVSTDVSILRTGLMFDRYVLKHKSHIVLQYLPQMLIYNGDVHANAATNNDLSLGTKFQLTPRLNLTVEDSFIQVHDNSLVPQNYLAVDSRGGALAQNNFLNTNGNYLADTASVTLDYAFSPRTYLIFSPSYRYMQSLNSVSNYLAKGNAYTGTVALGHALTPHRTVGISGSAQYLLENIGGVPQNATYYTAAGFYSEQLARTVWASVSLGATNQRYSGSPQAGSWGLAANASLTKYVSRRISLAVLYNRGTAFSNYVTRERSDRVDGSLRIQPFKRVAWNNSLGYLRELGGLTPTSGKYAESDLTYRFYGNFSVFTTFAYTFQISGTQQLLSGDRKTLAWGLRWAPPRVAPN
jgi:hypothetical protein